MTGFLGTLYLLAGFVLTFSLINLLFQVSERHAFIILGSYFLMIGIETYFKYKAKKEINNEQK